MSYWFTFGDTFLKLKKKTTWHYSICYSGQDITGVYDLLQLCIGNHQGYILDP